MIDCIYMCYIILWGSVIINIIYHAKCCKNIYKIFCILFCLIQPVGQQQQKKKADIFRQNLSSSEVALFII